MQGVRRTTRHDMTLSELRDVLERMEWQNSNIDVVVYDTKQQEYCEPLVGRICRDGKYYVDLTCGEPI